MGTGKLPFPRHWVWWMYSAPAVGSTFQSTRRSVRAEIIPGSHARTARRVRPHAWIGGRAGIEPALPCTPHRQSSVCIQWTDEVLTRDVTVLCHLSYGVILCGSGAGGTRTHNHRVVNHVLRIGSRSLFSGETLFSSQKCAQRRIAETVPWAQVRSL